MADNPKILAEWKKIDWTQECAASWFLNSLFIGKASCGFNAQKHAMEVSWHKWMIIVMTIIES